MHSPKAYLLSAAAHVLLLGCVACFTTSQIVPVSSSKEHVITIVPDADDAPLSIEEKNTASPDTPSAAHSDASLPDEINNPPRHEVSSPSIPEAHPLPVAVMDEAGSSNETKAEMKRDTMLLSEMPAFAIEELPEGLLGENKNATVNRQSDRKRNNPIVATSNTTASVEETMNKYNMIFIQSIRDAYKMPGELNIKETLTVRVQYEVFADGTIGSVNIVRSSGSNAYDQSVVRAFRSIASVGPRPGKLSGTFVADFCLGG